MSSILENNTLIEYDCTIHIIIMFIVLNQSTFSYITSNYHNFINIFSSRINYLIIVLIKVNNIYKQT